MVDFSGNVYEKYHQYRRLQKRIIDEKNFTYRNLLAILKKYISKKSDILDIGCGVGTVDLYLAAKGKNVTGIEISKNALQVARKNAKLLGLDKKTKFLLGDFTTTFLGKKFDLIICSEVLEHLREDKGVVEKIYKLLKKHGLGIISTPSKNAPLYKLGLLSGFDREVGHLRRYTQEELTLLFENIGFKIVHSAKTEGILRNFLFTNKVAGKLVRFIKWGISDLVTFIDNSTIPVFGESQIYLVVQKL